MRLKAWMAAFGSMVLLVAGCGRGAASLDVLIEENLSHMAELNSVLASINDKPSAEAAKPKLAAIRSRMEAVQKRAEALGEPSVAERKRLEEKYGEAIREQLSKLVGQAMRITMTPGLEETMKEAMGDMPPLMP